MTSSGGTASGSGAEERVCVGAGMVLEVLVVRVVVVGVERDIVGVVMEMVGGGTVVEIVCLVPDGKNGRMVVGVGEVLPSRMNFASRRLNSTVVPVASKLNLCSCITRSPLCR